jgi:hypothetical protein
MIIITFSFFNKTFKTRQNSMRPCGGCTTVRRRKPAGWQASHNPKKGFVGFASFVTLDG